MEYVILDLEWDNSFFSRQDTRLNEIIEIGAVKTDEQLNILGEFSMLIKPELTRFISWRTKKLTHLTYEMLMMYGRPYKTALQEFKTFLGNSVLMTWSKSDIVTLMENHRYHYNTDILDYINQYVNVQRYCEEMLGYNDPSKQMGLTFAAEKLEINLSEIEHHRALDDSLLTLECLKKLYDKNKLMQFIEDGKNPDFYRRLVYKPAFIVDIDNPLIDKNHMNFLCEQCNSTTCRINEWQVKNKSFRADFKCPECQYEFIGKIQYKLKFDGLEVKKKVIPKAELHKQQEAN